MPVTITRQVTLFQFAELSDEAKETAREWFRSTMEADDFDFIVEDFETCAGIIGVDLDQQPVKLYGGGTRNEPAVRWSVSYSQGDGAAFRGGYAYKKGAHKAIRQHAPKDAELHRIADALLAIQRRYGYKVTARMTDGSLSNFYSHSGTMAVDVDADMGAGEKVPTIADDAAVTQLMRDLADWFYRRLVEHDTWRNADEQVDESIGMNEYTFDETGKRQD